MNPDKTKRIVATELSLLENKIIVARSIMKSETTNVHLRMIIHWEQLTEQVD